MKNGREEDLQYDDVRILYCNNVDFTRLIALREKTDVRILVVCDKIYFKQALDSGADSCIEPSQSREELEARIHALKRRAKKMRFKTTVLTAGSISINLEYHTVATGEGNITLSPSEYRVLTYLLLHRGVLIPKKQMEMHSIYNTTSVSAHLINVHIYNLRKKLGDAACIITVPRCGFLFEVSSEL